MSVSKIKVSNVNSTDIDVNSTKVTFTIFLDRGEENLCYAFLVIQMCNRVTIPRTKTSLLFDHWSVASTPSMM